MEMEVDVQSLFVERSPSGGPVEPDYGDRNHMEQSYPSITKQ